MLDRLKPIEKSRFQQKSAYLTPQNSKVELSRISFKIAFEMAQSAMMMGLWGQIRALPPSDRRQLAESITQDLQKAEHDAMESEDMAGHAARRLEIGKPASVGNVPVQLTWDAMAGFAKSWEAIETNQMEAEELAVHFNVRGVMLAKDSQ